MKSTNLLLLIFLTSCASGYYNRHREWVPTPDIGFLQDRFQLRITENYKIIFRTNFQVPIKAKYKVSSHYGMRWLFGKYKMHHGIDLAAKRGTPVYAADKGQVIWRGWARGYGKTIVIQHPNGYRTLYGHLHSYTSKYGEWVTKKSIIGKVGSTGRSTGNHLHFEVLYKGESYDPVNFLDF